MPETLTLSTFHVGPKDLMVMRSLLNLAGGRDSGRSWQISDGSDGDVKLVDVDQDEGEDIWKQLTQEGQAVIALSKRKDFPASHLLHKPLRSRAFLKVLTDLAEGGSGVDVSAGVDEEAPSAPDEPAEANVWQAIDVDERAETFTLAEHLRRQSWSKPVVITHPGWPLILIDPGSGAWFFDGSISELSPPMFAEPMPVKAGVPISSADLVDRVSGHRQRPLSELKWFAGLAQSRGRLHPDLLGEVEFMLTQVPAEAMKNEQLHRLARILIRGPISLEDLRSESDQPPENVMAFLNACYTSGKLLVNRVARVASF